MVDVKAPGVLTHPKYGKTCSGSVLNELRLTYLVGPSYPGGERISEPDGPKVILP